MLFDSCPDQDYCWTLNVPVYSSTTGGSSFTHLIGVMACPSEAFSDIKYTTQIKRRQ